MKTNKRVPYYISFILAIILIKAQFHRYNQGIYVAIVLWSIPVVGLVFLIKNFEKFKVLDIRIKISRILIMGSFVFMGITSIASDKYQGISLSISLIMFVVAGLFYKKYEKISKANSE